MDIHKPKPFHGVREFLKEYGIIVLGVLTALGLEQAVEALHWRHAVESQRKALDGELSARLDAATARLSQEPCIQGRLKELRIVFERHKAGEPLGLVGPVGAPAVVGAAQGVWATAAGSQTMEHMPAEERERYGSAFSGFAALDESLNGEARTWDDLAGLDQVEFLETGDWPALHAAYTRTLAWDQRNRFFAEWVLKHDAGGRKPADRFKLDDLTRLKEPVRNLCRSMLASAG